MRGEYVGSDGVAVTADLEIADRQLSRLSLTARSAGAGDAGEERLAPVVAATPTWTGSASMKIDTRMPPP